MKMNPSSFQEITSSLDWSSTDWWVLERNDTVIDLRDSTAVAIAVVESSLFSTSGDGDSRGGAFIVFHQWRRWSHKERGADNGVSAVQEPLPRALERRLRVWRLGSWRTRRKEGHQREQRQEGEHGHRGSGRAMVHKLVHLRLHQFDDTVMAAQGTFYSRMSFGLAAITPGNTGMDII
ncbi:bifunctional diguanylate cyclase/phosphodiesterase [Sesbania bispinosa]|nr:bifunctional diguanylate cyclase/phosphodiesterase [Sesbania bispinosa]